MIAFSVLVFLTLSVSCISDPGSTEHVCPSSLFESDILRTANGINYIFFEIYYADNLRVKVDIWKYAVAMLTLQMHTKLMVAVYERESSLAGVWRQCVKVSKHTRLWAGLF
jgi:hypothetical protein